MADDAISLSFNTYCYIALHHVNEAIAIYMYMYFICYAVHLNFRCWRSMMHLLSVVKRKWHESAHLLHP